MYATPFHPSGWINSDSSAFEWTSFISLWYSTGERVAVVIGNNDVRLNYQLYPGESTGYATFVTAATEEDPAVVDNGDGTWTINALLNEDGFAVDWYGLPLEGESTAWAAGFSDADSAPDNYAVILYADDFDPRFVFKADILSHTSTSVTIAAQPEWLLNIDLEDLADIRAKIIDSRGYSWAERFPEAPNSWEYETGTATAVASGVLTDNTKTWPVGYWATAQSELAGEPEAFHLICKDTDDIWQRIPVTASTATTISFVAEGWELAAGEYFLIASDGWWIPQRRAQRETFPWVDGEITVQSQGDTHRPLEWYRGYVEAKDSHDPATDTLAGVNIAKTTLTRTVGETEEGCEEEEVNDLLDNDLRNSFTDVCSGWSDRIWTPHIHKSLRHMQVVHMGLAGSFVDEYYPASLAEVSNLTVATWFSEFLPEDINWFSTTIENIEDVDVYETVHYNFGDYIDSISDFCYTAEGCDIYEQTGTQRVVTLADYILPDKTPGHPHEYLECVWTLLGDDGLVEVTRNDFGTGANAVAADSITSDTFSTYHEFDIDNDIGKAIVIAYGYTRFFARQFRYYYAQERRYFVGDTFPPTAEDPGEWRLKGDETRSIEFDNRGYVGVVLGDPYRDGEAYEYVGDSFWHVDAAGALAPRLNIVRPGLGTGLFNPSKVGTATAGDTWYIEDDSATFWEGSEKWTLSGTAGSGSTENVIIDVAKNNSDLRCIDPEYWIGHLIEATFNEGEEDERVEFRVITEFDSTGAQIQFGVERPFSETTVGCSYGIDVPRYLRDRFLGRLLRVKNPDGETVDIVIERSANKRLIVPEQEFSLDGLGYEVIEENVGSVFHRVSGAWQKPTPVDATTPDDTRGKSWHANQFENQPTICRSFGLMRCGDYVLYYNGGVKKELEAGINKMNWLYVAPTWSSRDYSHFIADLPENNHKAVDVISYPDSSTDHCADVKAAAATAWAGAVATEESGPPSASTGVSATADFNSWVAGAYRQYAYACLTRPARGFASIISIAVQSNITGNPAITNPQLTDVGTNWQRYEFNESDEFEFKQWTEIATTSASTTADLRIKCGDSTLSLPDWPSVCPPVADGSPRVSNTSTSNATITNQAAFVKFNVTGGFLFIDHTAD